MHLSSLIIRFGLMIKYNLQFLIVKNRIFRPFSPVNAAFLNMTGFPL